MPTTDDPMRELLLQAIEGDDMLAQLLVAYFTILGHTEQNKD